MRNYLSWLAHTQIDVDQRSSFNCAGDLVQTKVTMQGVGNRFDLAPNAKIRSYDIAIAGSGNILEIAENFTANGNHTAITMGD